MRSPTDVALDRHLSPVNKTAARVVSKGVDWTPDKKILTIDSQNPIPHLDIPRGQLVRKGMKAGHLTVMGLYDVPANSKGYAYVCRCDCGYYTVRRSPSIRNPDNNIDCCGRCRQKAYLRRHNEFRTFGRNRT